MEASPSLSQETVSLLIEFAAFPINNPLNWRILLLTQHAFTLRDFNTRQMTKNAQLYEGEFNHGELHVQRI